MSSWRPRCRHPLTGLLTAVVTEVVTAVESGVVGRCGETDRGLTETFTPSWQAPPTGSQPQLRGGVNRSPPADFPRGASTTH